MGSQAVDHSSRVLFAVLDWGLGHAARSIQIIKSLLQRGAEVNIASSGDALVLLKFEFPHLKYFELPSYRVEYSSSGLLFLKLIIQTPKFLKAIAEEHKVTTQILQQHAFDLIISDNRYGCWSKYVKSILITHQIHLIMPGWLHRIAALVEHYNKKQINKFNECWIPDEASRLTGKLTWPPPKNHRFIGNTSRFEKIQKTDNSDHNIVVVISGPEPQRTIFEKEVSKQLLALNLRSLVIRGLVSKNVTVPDDSGKVTFVNHLNSEELNQYIQEAGVVVCRSGYTSIMDLAILQKKQIFFVPTPGQTEQEYLAKMLLDKKIAFYQEQSQLNLEVALSELKKYSGFEAWNHKFNLLKNAIDTVLK